MVPNSPNYLNGHKNILTKIPSHIIYKFRTPAQNQVINAGVPVQSSESIPSVQIICWAGEPVKIK